jgi:hypothetical protein
VESKARAGDGYLDSHFLLGGREVRGGEIYGNLYIYIIGYNQK